VTAHQATTGTELEKLDDTGLALDDLRQDIRGRKLVDQQGEGIGHVSNLFIDAGERKVRMLEVRAGGFLGIGVKHFLLPVDAVTSVGEDVVHVNETRERIAHSPAYNPHLVQASTREYWEPFYGYYGLSPYWGNGYLYPGFPLSLDQRPAVNEHSGHAQDL
jgi:sporulation protein YlmC with PRC-barrel domain